MSKVDFISGSVFEFRLLKGMGFAYCKVLDFRNLSEIDGVLAKVFDLIVDKPIKDISILREKDWLFGARRLYNLPNSRGRGAWRFKGVLLSKNDDEIPDFKYSTKLSSKILDESIIEKWYISRNIVELNYNEVYSHDQVKHLEDTKIDSTISIEIRASMEYYRKQKKDIKSDFDLGEISNWNNYRRMINVPIYSSIPKEIRGKVNIEI